MNSPIVELEITVSHDLTIFHGVKALAIVIIQMNGCLLSYTTQHNYLQR